MKFSAYPSKLLVGCRRSSSATSRKSSIKGAPACFEAPAPKMMTISLMSLGYPALQKESTPADEPKRCHGGGGLLQGAPFGETDILRGGVRFQFSWVDVGEQRCPFQARRATRFPCRGKSRKVGDRNSTHFASALCEKAGSQPGRARMRTFRHGIGLIRDGHCFIQ